MARMQRSSNLLRVVLAAAACAALQPLLGVSVLGFVGGGRLAPPAASRHLTQAARDSSSVARRAAGQDGVFTPLVKSARFVMGDDAFTKFRGNVIKAHTNVIQQFVDTYDTRFGRTALENLFHAADTDRSGALDRHEIRAACDKLGFEWLSEDKVLAKGDKDGNELIDYNEFVTAAPTLLKQNLVKLAKKNGGQLGFLS